MYYIINVWILDHLFFIFLLSIIHIPKLKNVYYIVFKIILPLF